jgi:hypothetical protein
LWADKNGITTAFDRLFQHYRQSILVVSYRSDGVPTEAELIALLQKYKKQVQVERYGQYQYALSKIQTLKNYS